MPKQPNKAHSEEASGVPVLDNYYIRLRLYLEGFLVLWRPRQDHCSHFAFKNKGGLPYGGATIGENMSAVRGGMFRPLTGYGG